jgi:hypothetical protein
MTGSQVMKKAFTARLEGRGPTGSWTFLPIPFNVEEVFGSRARVPVSGTIIGHAYRCSLMPGGDGTHSMMVNKELKKGASAENGDRVTVIMGVDKAERKVVVPPDLGLAIGKEPLAQRFFGQLSYSCRKEYTDWIQGAKPPETRSVRVTKTIAPLKAKRRQR